MRRGEAAAPDQAAADGVSPVCPHCHRFISHYKVGRVGIPGLLSVYPLSLGCVFCVVL